MWFFFSSRRRHTRFKCDWSSDVCSSDLSSMLPASSGSTGVLQGTRTFVLQDEAGNIELTHSISAGLHYAAGGPGDARSEGPRVGEECRSRGAPDHLKKKIKQRLAARGIA